MATTTHQPTPTRQPTATHRRPPGIDTAALVARTRAGDRAAFAEIYRSTLDTLTRYVTVRVGERDRDAVADLVHDAYCFALTEPTLIGTDPVGSLLRLAARAVTRHHWSTRRYLRAAHTVAEDQHTGPTPDPSGPSTPTAPETLPRITFAHALARLTPNQRRAIELRHIDGYPRDTAATLMGRTPEAVRQLERAALRRLHQHFQPATPPPPQAARIPTP